MGSFNVNDWLNKIKREAEDMGYRELQEPVVSTQLNALRVNDQPNGYLSTPTIWMVIAAATTMPYASRENLELAAQNGYDFEPVEPPVRTLENA